MRVQGGGPITQPPKTKTRKQLKRRVKDTRIELTTMPSNSAGPKNKGRSEEQVQES